MKQLKVEDEKMKLILKNTVLASMAVLSPASQATSSPD